MTEEVLICYAAYASGCCSAWLTQTHKKREEMKQRKFAVKLVSYFKHAPKGDDAEGHLCALAAQHDDEREAATFRVALHWLECGWSSGAWRCRILGGRIWGLVNVNSRTRHGGARCRFRLDEKGKGAFAVISEQSGTSVISLSLRWLVVELASNR